MTSSAFPHLFTPLTVGAHRLRHRVVMGSMHLGLENRGADLAALGAFYAERARGGADLMITGGFSPNLAGVLDPLAGTMMNARDAARHEVVTSQVHEAGGRIALQLLHAGRYSYHPLSVSASAAKAPITPFTPRALSTHAVEKTVRDFVDAAGWAQRAGYDGVEIMGSEGYLINQFLAPRTNDRTDAWGGTPARRRRFAVEIARRIRLALGPEFLISFRMSMVDLVPEGQSLQETLDLARELEAAGVDLLNTGIGWHEARVPTIVTSVPRAAFVDFTRRVREVVSIPVAASNRITMPHTAEQILAEDQADLVTMSRPFLADPQWVAKAQSGSPERINSCIGCNQACLDHTFEHRPASCLVNPTAGRETEEPFRHLLPVLRVTGAWTSAADAAVGDAPTGEAPEGEGAPVPHQRRLRVAVVGAGPAGLAAATTAAALGHRVDLFEAHEEIGGQFRLARQIPGKEEFAETLRYFQRRLQDTGVEVHLGHRVTAQELVQTGYDQVLLASGVVPRELDLPGADRANVHSYADVVDGRVVCGPRVAIIGAGGIGFDVAELLTEPAVQTDPFTPAGGAGEPQALEDWQRDWGVDPDFAERGGVRRPAPAPAAREVFLIQRKTTKMGAGLGKTTGWVHRATLKARGVQMITGASYQRIDDAGLHLIVPPEDTRVPRRSRRPTGLLGTVAQQVVGPVRRRVVEPMLATATGAVGAVGERLGLTSTGAPADPAGVERVLEVDDVVICAGQESCRDLVEALEQAGQPFTLIGGSDVAAELDAKRAIEQATRVAATL